MSQQHKKIDSVWARMSSKKEDQESLMEKKPRDALSTLNMQPAGEITVQDDAVSAMSDLNFPSLFETSSSEFELMHVRVTVLGLSGITSTLSKKKTKRKNMKGRPDSTKSGMSTTSFASVYSTNHLDSASSMSSMSSMNSFGNFNGVPTTAVLTYERNVSSSSTSISSHLPSLPLGMPTSAYGYTSRFMASWPTEQVPFAINGEKQTDQATFTLLRVMMKQQYFPDRTGSLLAEYVPETIDLRINLSRGKEMITLGFAEMVISGDEEGLVHMTIPARSARSKRGGGATDTRRSLTPRMFKNKNKKACFKSDSARKFALDENATLRVAVQVLPHSIMKETEAAKARKKFMLGSDEGTLATKEERKRERMRSYLSDRQSTMSRHDGSRLALDALSPQSHGTQAINTGFLCGNFCDDRLTRLPFHAKHSARPQIEADDEASMESSVLSSVSESGSESESESEEEREIHINRRICVRKSYLR